ncbi:MULTISPECIES: FadR/GntR family transcriptional regulator [unclassified Devosia]|uniref:FadR/GntR family transcriptional regulator n=1 Tax=unclassified Devosia TaxID=196773 RepID=UPI0015530446|nr:MULTISPECIES: FadR/GntR family transcriptional regulator [unclassified Devosia]
MSIATDGNSPEGGSAASVVADHLARQILTEMIPGTSLPSEAELALRYQVSRLTIRESVKLLEGRGLLEIAKGRRAVVREPDGAAFTDFLTSVLRYDPKGLFDLMEVRMSLEVQSATLAAKRASRAGTAAIEHALQGMRDAAGESETAAETHEVCFNDHDLAFHEAVALASGNRVLGYLFEGMAPALREGFTVSQRGHQRRGHTVWNTIADHERIFECIKSGNGRAAGEAMRLHLKDTERDMRAALTMALPQTPRL